MSEGNPLFNLAQRVWTKKTLKLVLPLFIVLALYGLTLAVLAAPANPFASARPGQFLNPQGGYPYPYYGPIDNVQGKVFLPPACDLTAPARWVDVYASDAYDVWGWGQTNFMGKYAFPLWGVPPGGQTYWLEVDPWSVPPGYLPPDPISFTLSGPADQVTLPDLCLKQPNKVLNVTVQFPDGTPVPNALGRVWSHRTNQLLELNQPTGPSGQFSVNLGQGRWSVWVEPVNPWNAGWDYYGEEIVGFPLPDPVPETRNIVLTVVPWGDLNEVIGRVLDPQNNPAPPGTFVELWNEFFWDGVEVVTSTGRFTMYVPSGWYELWTWPGNNNFLPPISNGEEVLIDGPVNLGDIFLQDRVTNATVGGRVVLTGTTVGVAGVDMYAFNYNTGDWLQTTTNQNGDYSFGVLAGWWEIGFLDWPDGVLPVGVDWWSGYVPKGANIGNINFFMAGGGNLATITGVFTSGGAVVPIGGSVFAERTDGKAVYEAEVNVGQFTLRVLPGYDYNVGAVLPAGVPYVPTPPGPVSVTGTLAVTITHNIPLIKADVVLSGTVMDVVNSTVATQAEVSVIANQGSLHFETGVDGASPGFSMNVTPGDWDIDYDVDPASGYMRDPAWPNPSVVGAVSGGKIGGLDLGVRPIDSVITVTATAGGNPAANVWVYAASALNGNVIVEAQTDGTGVAALNVAAGQYYVGGSLNNVLAQQGYLPPAEQLVTPTVAAPVQVSLVYTKPAPGAQATITGTVVFSVPGSVGVPAPAGVLVTARAGDHLVETTTDASGRYTMTVTQGFIWNLWAVYEDTANNTFYESDKTPVEVQLGTSALNQDLILMYPRPLPPSECLTFDRTRLRHFFLPGKTLPDGTPLGMTTVTIPENAVPSNDANLTFCYTPRVALSSGGSLLSFGYEMEVRDSRGVIRKDFNAQVRMSFFYDDSEVPDESLIDAAFYSTNRNTWVKMDDVVLDPATNFVTGKSDHFSAWALVSQPGLAQEAGKPSVYLPLVVRNK